MIAPSLGLPFRRGRALSQRPGRVGTPSATRPGRACKGAWLLAPSSDICPPSRALVIRTQPNRESVADSFLRQFGFETYFPQVRKRVRHARQILDVDQPFFPMYLFVWNHDDLNHRELRRAPGVSSVVHMGDDPAAVVKGVVDAIRAREVIVPAIRKPGETVRRIVLDKPTDGPEFVQDEVLRVTKGPMAGLPVLFVCQRGADRSEILVRLFGQWSQTTIRTKHLERT